MTDQVRATKTDWSWLERIHRKADTYINEPHICNISIASCLVELRDRVVALEAAGGVAGNPGHAPAAPAGVTIHELTRALDHVGCDSAGTAYVLWNHPRIGPLLRGEGAPAPKRVVLPEEPPFWRMPYVEGPWSADALARAVWAAARAALAAEPPAPAPVIPLDLDALLSPEGAYEPGTGQEDGAQLVDLCWWAPMHGCETLENLLDRIRGRILPHLRPPIAGIDVPGTDGDYGGLQELCDAEGVDVRIGAPLLKRAREAWGAAQPPAPGPTIDDIWELCEDHEFHLGIDGANEEESAEGLLKIINTALGRWGRPAPAPADHVPSAENMVALGWEPEACLLSNMTASQLARAAALLRQPAPAPTELTPVAYDAGSGVTIERIIAEDGDWSVRNSRHISPVIGFPTAAAAWAALQQGRRQEESDE